MSILFDDRNFSGMAIYSNVRLFCADCAEEKRSMTNDTAIATCADRLQSPTASPKANAFLSLAAMSIPPP
jgi:hypothetical protein